MVKSDVVRDVDHYSSAPYNTILISEEGLAIFTV
jgi:hypothetical protein